MNILKLVCPTGVREMKSVGEVIQHLLIMDKILRGCARPNGFFSHVCFSLHSKWLTFDSFGLQRDTKLQRCPEAASIF